MEVLANKQSSHEPASNQLDSLLNQLPFKYESLRISEDQRPDGFKFFSNGFTIETHYDGKEIIVCGEAFDATTATAKAISELIERSVLIKYTAKNSALNKTSNGWAAHFEKKQAQFNAALEIIERDAVLAQWYSATPFFEIEITSLPKSITDWVETQLSRSEFPVLKILASSKGIGPSVTCVLMNERGFGVCGHSSKIDLLFAIENAIGEACRAGHLILRNAHYEDSKILMSGDLGIKINPGAHAVYYAYQETFPNWMFGEKISWTNAVHSWNLKMTNFASIQFFDFAIETVLTEPVFVCFAKHSEALELSWGAIGFDKIRNLNANKRLLGNKINLKPHPIS
ncbi:MAG: YcaO-like family protein [Pseudobdellovibrio sp.]